jgi:hypothetical protein
VRHVQEERRTARRFQKLDGMLKVSSTAGSSIFSVLWSSTRGDMSLL